MKIAVLGCGNMAQALITGIARENKNIEFHTYTPSFTRAKELADKVGGVAQKELADFSQIDYWVIACKPQQFDDLAKSLGDKLVDQKVISILAAISTEKIAKSLNSKKILRIMPNTPSKISAGISLLYARNEVEKKDIEFIHQLFSACSKVIKTNDEKEFDQLTTISGSGPAYIFFFAKTYVDAAKSMGLSAQDARELVNKLFLGSALLMDQDSSSLDEMIAAVTSKGGVTIEAVNVLMDNDITQIINFSLESAYKRSKQITQDYS